MTRASSGRGAVSGQARGVPRDVVVTPGMCSGGSLIFGRIGDWTWQVVGDSCGMNVHGARTADGDPAYLSFYYFHVRGGEVIHPHGLTFGDELSVMSRAFRFGTQSVITLHRMSPAGLELAEGALDPAEVYEHPHPDCLYAETFNRWIARTSAGSNRNLAQVVPPGFSHHDLPLLPNEYSPRSLVGRARATGTFYPSGPPACHEAGSAQTFEYVLDVVRDLNGAGLMYFASYFSVFDTVLLHLWRSLGRTDEQFLRRKVTDQKIGYFGNADPGAVFTITARRWWSTERRDIEIADMAMHDTATGQLIAVTALEVAVTESVPSGDG
ncbi:biosynthesis cluster domain-containing protein [Streptomyces sp. ACA25]|uniref:LnmK family bifunctional acyltransferase/decarboxylase n=1 Tax=Streptomyces sp. ACA25 TaxID=3022596 RepID=UPI0023078A4D|nr:LnmK family bifunctional acyltransferase/decarboxylase [Streptomyces sp. ACA25]MDB1089746.1 biosynthesis cluster domain-containing protein [Streptomyces sp. ACA25]